jgi:DNA invertase Pin-like site-specific DNA recombinase
VKVAIYASADEDGRYPEDELVELRDWCTDAGHTVVAEYVDRAGGRNGARKRMRFAAMFDAAYHGEFDMVLVWALDRIGRMSMAMTVGYLHRLATAGVAFHSRTEPALSTDNEIIRATVQAVIASLAEADLQRISTKLARVRARGTRVGRPALPETVQAQIVALAGGTPPPSNYAIAKQLKLTPHTVRKYRLAAAMRMAQPR